MKTRFQILLKGKATNRLYLYEFKDYMDYKLTLNEIDYNMYILLDVNHYSQYDEQ